MRVMIQYGETRRILRFANKVFFGTLFDADATDDAVAAAVFIDAALLMPCHVAAAARARRSAMREADAENSAPAQDRYYA